MEAGQGSGNEGTGPQGPVLVTSTQGSGGVGGQTGPGNHTVQAPVAVPGPNDDDAHLNADLQSAQRTKLRYTTGGVQHNPVPKTGKVIKKVIELSPDGELGNSRAENVEAIDILYKQLAVLVRPVNGAWSLDDADIDARADELQETLDLEDARAWMRNLLPPQEVAAAGEAEAAS